MQRKFLSLVLFVFYCSFASAQELRLATYQYSTNKRIENLRPMAAYLQKNCGTAVVVKSYPSVDALIRAIRNSEVDIALINTLGFCLLECSGETYPMEPQLNMLPEEGSADNYKTVIVAGRDVPVNDLVTLKQNAGALSLVLVNKDSTSGNLIPRLAFRSAGIDQLERNSFASFSYGNSHKATLEAVIAGKADIGAMGKNEYDNYLQTTANAGAVKLIWTSQEIPLGPVLINKRMTTEMKNAVVSALMQLHAKDAAAWQALKAGWSESKNGARFMPANRETYATFLSDCELFKELMLVDNSK